MTHAVDFVKLLHEIRVTTSKVIREKVEIISAGTQVEVTESYLEATNESRKNFLPCSRSAGPDFCSTWVCPVGHIRRSGGCGYRSLRRRGAERKNNRNQ